MTCKQRPFRMDSSVVKSSSVARSLAGSNMQHGYHKEWTKGWLHGSQPVGVWL